jgi:hypothetical protein
MHRAFIMSAALLGMYVSAAGAQGIKPSDAAGTWHTKGSVGPNDSASVMSVTTVSADGKTWSTKTGNGAPHAVRVVAFGGDSIVTEAGPYPSALRPGQTVSLIRSVGHYKGDSMTGTFVSHYADGKVATGKLQSTRTK